MRPVEWVSTIIENKNDVPYWDTKHSFALLGLCLRRCNEAEVNEYRVAAQPVNKDRFLRRERLRDGSAFQIVLSPALAKNVLRIHRLSDKVQEFLKYLKN